MIPCGTAVRILIPKDGAMIRGTLLQFAPLKVFGTPGYVCGVVPEGELALGP